jgi:hypothetical protein
MVSGIGYGQGIVSRPVGVLDAAASSFLRRFNQSSSGIVSTANDSGAGINLSEGRSALASAVSAADTVIDRLTTLKDRISIARDISVPSLRGDYNLFALQAEADQMVRSIDSTVAQAATSGVNLIGAPATNVRISSPNGTVAVTAQPLGSQDLGVARLDLTSDAGIEAAFAAVGAALTTATSRRELLASVNDELSNAQGFTATLAGALRGLSVSATGREPRVGAALDIRA